MMVSRLFKISAHKMIAYYHLYKERNFDRKGLTSLACEHRAEYARRQYFVQQHLCCLDDNPSTCLKF